jgi:hypothetical protein
VGRHPPLVLAAWLFALAVVSGITIRDEGPQEPMTAIMLAIIGPTANGPRPPSVGSPLAFTVSWPLLANLVAVAALLVAARWFSGWLDATPQASDHNEDVALALVGLI